jgi:hypothetical protein
MKDVPHHMMKFLKKIAKETPKKESSQEEDNLFKKEVAQKKSSDQEKKQRKLEEKKEKLARIPSDPTPEERNRKMKKRVPIRKDRSMKTFFK